MPLATAVVGALLFTNAFFVIWLATTKFTGMMVLGFGDVRLAAVLGLLLGWYGLPYVLYGAVAGTCWHWPSRSAPASVGASCTCGTRSGHR